VLFRRKVLPVCSNLYERTCLDVEHHCIYRSLFSENMFISKALERNLFCWVISSNEFIIFVRRYCYALSLELIVNSTRQGLADANGCAGENKIDVIETFVSNGA
jgi:hypothetical protein